MQNYRSVRDTGWFNVELNKTIFVGINEAGKSAVLQALQHLNPPPEVVKLDPLRDYPRGAYNEISTGKVTPSKTYVVQGRFALDDDDKAILPEGFRDCVYCVGRTLDNTARHWLESAPAVPVFADVEQPLARLVAHVDVRVPAPPEGTAAQARPSATLLDVTKGWTSTTPIAGKHAQQLEAWLKAVFPLIDEGDAKEEERYDQLLAAAQLAATRDEVLKKLSERTPVFVLFNNYFRVRPNIHLEHLASRSASRTPDEQQYDFGNECLLKLLGFTARELSDLGRVAEPPVGDAAALGRYKDQLDERRFKLNAASVRLTDEIRSVWRPDTSRNEADRLRLQADQQYLKVVVEDELGVEIELDQRSEGFQWLVSFFVVFFAEAGDRYKNAILLLDEPGLSLHGLKQREFRNTISRLADSNQTIYTTHSPFLVGPNELDFVRVVELNDRRLGTKVHTQVVANDAASLLPLQEALGYDLAQSLFGQEQNLVLEGLTDYWYLDATAQLLRAGGVANLDERIALVAAGSAGKVVYYATILHAQRLKVAALLDSDAAGDQAANQDVLVHALGNRRILRTKDVYNGSVPKPEIEDLLRDTLVAVGRDALSCDVSATAAAQPARPIIDIFTSACPSVSKYHLAKAYVRWTRDHTASDLSAVERTQWAALIQRISAAFA